jgi:hypothetical protein
MTSIVSLAFIASVICIWWKSYRHAFLYVYVPVLICVPSWTRWNIDGLPDPTFQQAALLPIALASLFRGKHRLSRLDYLVAAFVVLSGFSEYMNAGYSDAQNLMFDMVFSGLIPYLVAKEITADPKLRLRFVKMFVLSESAVILMAVFELKFAYNPYRLIFDPFFPGQGDGWVTTFRYGLPRVAGPYGHAISAGIMFMIALRLQCWLENAGLWHSKIWQSKIGRFRLSKILTFWNFFGLCITFVKGPQIGAFLAWLVFWVSRSKRPRVNFKRAFIGLVVVGIPLLIWFFSWISVGRAGAVTDNQETAAYRKELIEKYSIIVWQHAWYGWGLNTWPKVPGMPSIDNNYLLLALEHGLPALALFVALIAIISVKLFKAGIKLARRDPANASLSFSLLSIYVGVAFSLATAYLGENVFPVFFALCGFSAAWLASASGEPVKVAMKPVARKRAETQLAGPRFRRVLG